MIVVLPENFGYISAFLTMRCNLDCGFCLNAFSRKFDRKKFKETSGKLWVTALNKIESRPEIPITFSGGEPFLHKDFIYILNNVKPDLNIDILTNLQWGKRGLEKFIDEVDPKRIERDSPYPSIRVSYHPEQMGDGGALVESVRALKDAGFSIGIWAVLYPSPAQLSAINQMQFKCLDSGVEFRLKEFTGEYGGEEYGDYSKYPGATFKSDSELHGCLCRPSELLMSTDCRTYRCHRDLFSEESSTGNILDPNFRINTDYAPCDRYGQCHPCDVKVKTNSRQKLGHTSVEIEK